MFRKPSPAMMTALRDFVFRHEIFVEAHEFDDGFIFTRKPRRRSRRLGPGRHFEVFLRRGNRRVRFFSLTCGSEEQERPAEAAIEYDSCGHDAKRYAAQFPKDPDAAQALFGYVRSESRLLVKLLGNLRYKELLRLVRRHSRTARGRAAKRRTKSHQRLRRS